MCRPVRCRICGKITWAGCGLHVEQALAGVAAEDRCGGHDDAAPAPGFLGRLFGG